MHIELQNINKSFGAVHANKNISLTFNAGRIIGVLGENGAGKSTLMKILSGYQGADSGSILIDGTPTDFSKPQVAIANGIGMLQQDPLDVGAFTVLENFIYGQAHRNPFFRRQKARYTLRDYATKFDFELDPDSLIQHLSIAQRQQLEIVRLLAQGVQTLILDEPTTGISAEQKDKLFNALRSLAESGTIILLVSHKLEDVMALCHEVVVLRAGELVGQADMPLTQSDIVRMMFGEDIVLPTIERESVTERPALLNVDKLHATDGRLHVENFDLSVHAGEIIGFAGLDGSGQELIMRVCAGLMSASHGKVRYKDRDVRQTDYPTLYREGLIYSAAGRIEEGLIAGLTLTEHITLAEKTDLFVDWQAMRKLTRERITHYQVRGQAEDTIESLSGGNQQRVLMAMMPETPDLMILEHPTRGLDVDSANWIWQQLLARCQRGAGLIFTSPELDEIVRYSHRVVVFYAGRTYLVNDPTAITTEQLGHLIGGEF